MPVHIYADELVGRIKKVWRKTWLYVRGEEPPPLPADGILHRLLDVAYHASLMTEEGRRPCFHIVCCTREEFDRGGPRIRSCVKTTFAEPVAFDENQLLRLAPATDPASVLIAVEPGPGKAGNELRIWGLIDAGSSWWSHMRRESDRTIHSPPDLLTISSQRPGQLVISRAWRDLLKLENGRIVLPPVDVFLDGPVADEFAAPIAELCRRISPPGVPEDRYEPQLTRHNCTVKYVTYIKRLLMYFMDQLHGGLLVIVPEELADDPKLSSLVAIKYCCRHYGAWEKLIDALKLRRTWSEAGARIVGSTGLCEKERVLELTHLRSGMEEMEHEMSDRLQLIAALSGVDGAVVLTDRLRLLGFGAELKGAATVSVVYRALDSRARQREQVLPETFGTRHRSAFRFAADFGKGTVFVHSQDGGLKAVKKLGRDVVYWDVNPVSD